MHYLNSMSHRFGVSSLQFAAWACFSAETGAGLPGRGELINIINADELEYSSLGGTRIRKLTGHVQLQQKDATLFCDQANYFLDQNTIDAIGHVRIKQGDTINVYGNSLHYDGNLRKANLTGNVKLTDSHVTLTTDQLDYDLNTRVASYNRNGKVLSDSSVLSSKRGYYNANTAEVFFKQQVELVDPKYKLTTDTLKFNAQNRIAYFVSPSFIHSDSMDVYCEGGITTPRATLRSLKRMQCLRIRPSSLKRIQSTMNVTGVTASRVHGLTGLIRPQKFFCAAAMPPTMNPGSDCWQHKSPF